MDRNFLAYYEEELSHIRELATEFSALHPTVARNLSLDSVPCPDPYVERLLEGVAYLAARTRLKVDAESNRYVRNLLDELYPDLVCPAPAMTMAVLHPGPQVQTMLEGHVVQRGTRLVAAYREGVSTRATYTSAQDVTLWPIAIDKVEYLQDKGALNAAGLDNSEAEAAVRLTLSRVGPGSLAELGLDRLDLWFVGGSRGGAIFDAIFGHEAGAIARPAKGHSSASPTRRGCFPGSGLRSKVTA
jgi:type VI secretion system protein ImpG